MVAIKTLKNLSEAEKQDILDKGYEFSSVLLTYLNEGFDALMKNAAKKRQKYVFCLVWFKTGSGIIENEFFEQELVKTIEPNTFILETKPAMFLNTLCFKLNTISGEVFLEWILPNGEGWKNFRKGELFECKTVIKSCEKFLNFILTDESIRSSAYDVECDHDSLRDFMKDVKASIVNEKVETKSSGKIF